ncbi:hypothetical protein EV360DRAFT_66704 [Lentinula raphanica]|nr:hypothetical protein EV360DRAFT_66704 [Lentinula raphanica]
MFFALNQRSSLDLGNAAHSTPLVNAAQKVPPKTTVNTEFVKTRDRRAGLRMVTKKEEIIKAVISAGITIASHWDLQNGFRTIVRVRRIDWSMKGSSDAHIQQLLRDAEEEDDLRLTVVKWRGTSVQVALHLKAQGIPVAADRLLEYGRFVQRLMPFIVGLLSWALRTTFRDYCPRGISSSLLNLRHSLVKKVFYASRSESWKVAEGLQKGWNTCRQCRGFSMFITVAGAGLVPHNGEIVIPSQLFDTIRYSALPELCAH